MTFEETAINFLTRLEEKANEARNYDIRISKRKFLWVLAMGPVVIPQLIK